jgi:hypothetical protein
VSVVSASRILVTVLRISQEPRSWCSDARASDTDLEASHANLLRLPGGKWISPSKDIESQPQAIQAVVGVPGVVSASGQCQFDFGNSLGRLAKASPFECRSIGTEHWPPTLTVALAVDTELEPVVGTGISNEIRSTRARFLASLGKLLPKSN